MEKTKKSSAARALIISLVCMLLCSLLNWGVVTGWGNVKISRLNLIGNDGLQYSALLYVPKNATDENPAPAIMMYHGLSGSARNHESWAVEFTRRGFVCLAPDNMGAGDSQFEASFGEFTPNVISLYTDYLLDLPIVDSTRWVTAGHSLGADSSLAMCIKYQPTVAMFSDGGSMTFKSVTPENTYHGNFLFLLGEADKSGKPADYQSMTKTLLEYNGVTVEGDVEPEKLYGSFANNNAGMLTFIPRQVHEGAFTTPAHIEALLNFTQQAFEVPNYIEGSDQIWMWKDLLGMLGMISFACFLITLALFFIEKVPAFNSVKQPLPRNIGMRGVPFAISVAVAIIVPLLALYTRSFGLMTLLANKNGKGANSPLFFVKYANISFSIIIVLNVVGLLMFFLYHFTWGKKKYNASIRDYGLTSEGSTRLDWKLIGKALAVAVIVVAIGWTYLLIQKGVFGTDFYCLFWGYKPIAARKFTYYIPYMIVWALCFVVAAVGMCVERRLPSTGKEKLDNAIAVAFNAVLAVIAIAVVLCAETLIQFKLGHVPALSSWGVPLTRIWGMPIGMIIGSAGNTYLYRKTGSVWLGAILMGFVCALAACLYGQIQL